MPERRSPENSDLRSFRHICGLRALLTFGDFELHLVSLLQAFIPLGTDRAVVNKYVWPIRAPNEPVPFGVIEPLYGSFQSIHEKPPSFLHIPLRGQGRARSQSTNRMHFGTGGLGCQENVHKKWRNMADNKFAIESN